MKQIAIISDTHGLLREHVIAELAEADCSIHAGDIGTPSIVESIRQFGETYMVRGNNDKGVRFFIVHDKKDIPKYLTNVDVVVYGHSHKYSAEIMKGVLFLNPGSCGKRRFDLEITMCRMTVEAGRYRYEKVMIPL